MKVGRYLSVILILALTYGAANAQEKKESFIKGYSGGMMLHTGYLSGCDNPRGYNPQGVTFGIGGVAKVHMGKHLRAGFEGYVSTMNLMDNGSYNKVFWTGLLADWYWKAGRFIPYAGLTVGGGMETSHYMFAGDKEDWISEPDAVFHKEAFFAVDPFIGVEYALTEAMHLTLKTDWLLALNKNGINLPTGPRLYLGFIFSH